MKISRRDFVINSALTAAGLAYSHQSVAALTQPEWKSNHASLPDEQEKICFFSKGLQEIGYAEMISIAAAVGFDGIDLTVRPKGHVLPENVEKELPLAAQAARKAGQNIYMITTDILDADDRYTEPILRTAGSLGIKHYRMGRGFYDEKKSIPRNLEDYRLTFRKLDKLHRIYNIRGEYQNHSGSGFGAPVWDLWEVLKDTDPEWTGAQYDLYHATMEGANSWELGFNLLKPYIGTLDMKDFYWKKEKGKWREQITPLGEGMVDFKKFIPLLKKNGIHGPFSIHFEYFSSEDNVDRKREKMKNDLFTLRKWFKEAGL